MALRELLTALEQEAATEHLKAQQDRSREAAQIVADARAVAQGLHAGLTATAARRAHWEADVIASAARSTARRSARTARDVAIEHVRERVQQRLRDLPGTPDGLRLASRCLDEARAALPLAARARLHPADAAGLPSMSGPEVIADLDTGGAIVEDDHGRFVDNTYTTRLDNSWEVLRADLGRIWGWKP